VVNEVEYYPIITFQLSKGISKLLVHYLDPLFGIYAMRCWEGEVEVPRPEWTTRIKLTAVNLINGEARLYSRTALLLGGSE